MLFCECDGSDKNIFGFDFEYRLIDLCCISANQRIGHLLGLVMLTALEVCLGSNVISGIDYYFWNRLSFL